jgi:hypothetical protein
VELIRLLVEEFLLSNLLFVSVSQALMINWQAKPKVKKSKAAENGRDK